MFELEMFLDNVAAACRGRFESAWLGDKGRVLSFLQGEPPAVRAKVAQYLADQARVGWKAPGMATQVAGPVVAEARRLVERESRPAAGLFKSTTGRPSGEEIAAERDAGRRAALAALEGVRNS